MSPPAYLIDACQSFCTVLGGAGSDNRQVQARLVVF
jgi:hypothetical protein